MRIAFLDEKKIFFGLIYHCLLQNFTKLAKQWQSAIMDAPNFFRDILTDYFCM